jgi:endonuclease-3
MSARATPASRKRNAPRGRFADAGSESPAALRRRVVAIADALEAEYGRPRRHHGDPLDALVGTILSQNTSDVNSSLAFSRLKQRFRSWDEVADADVRSIEAAIRPGGLGHVKAPRIKRILRRIRQERGKLSLDFLARMSDDDARDHLLTLDGVGLKTAYVVLLFALDRKVFPVDTHVLRVSKRLEFIGPKTTADQAHALLPELIPPDRRHALHLNLVAHGRLVCKAQRPLCDRCVLNHADLCPYPWRHGLR